MFIHRSNGQGSRLQRRWWSTVPVEQARASACLQRLATPAPWSKSPWRHAQQQPAMSRPSKPPRLARSACRELTGGRCLRGEGDQNTTGLDIRTGRETTGMLPGLVWFWTTKSSDSGCRYCSTGRRIEEDQNIRRRRRRRIGFFWGCFEWLGVRMWIIFY